MKRNLFAGLTVAAVLAVVVLPFISSDQATALIDRQHQANSLDQHCLALHENEIGLLAPAITHSQQANNLLDIHFTAHSENGEVILGSVTCSAPNGVLDERRTEAIKRITRLTNDRFQTQRKVNELHGEIGKILADTSQQLGEDFYSKDDQLDALYAELEQINRSLVSEKALLN